MSSAAETRPPGTLKTRWAKDVSTTLPLPEYPRPQMQRDNWGNLNGPWEYAIRPAGNEPPDRWDGTILVPFPVESQLSGVQRHVGKANRLWYRRAFAKPALASGERLLLHFGAVDWHAIVRVNGTKVGEHKGGYDPFTFDVTDALTPVGEQTLVVSAWDPTTDGPQARGKQHGNPHGIWYTPVTGIWQTVWWEIVPSTHIARLKITPEIGRGDGATGRRGDGRVTVVVHVNGEAVGVTASARLLVDGESIASTEAPLTESGEQRAESAPSATLALDVPQPRLWSPDDPFLYDLEVTLRRGDAEIDRVTSYCALRKIALRKDELGVERIALNDAILFQLGPLDQGWWPDGLYTAPTDDALRFDIEVMKRFGFNAVRKHVKVEPGRWYYWADRLGLMVWQDMPNAAGFTPVGGPEGTATPEDSSQFRAELKAVIDSLYNHPSIVIWVPFNEGWGQHDSTSILRWTKEYDPTRLVDGPSGWTDLGCGDMFDLHRYPGPSMHAPISGRASVLGEFGGIGQAAQGHLWTEEKNWGYLNTRSLEELHSVYDGLIDDLQPLVRAGCAAAVYTQLTDVEVEVNGLLTYDREVVKFDPEKLARRHRALYAPATSLRIRTLVPTSQEAPQNWRYTSEEPGEGWSQPRFDDASWKTGVAPFGDPTVERFQAATPWTTPTIWLRRRFTLSEEEVAAVRDLHLWLQNNDAATIYVNGVELRREGGWSGCYRISPLGSGAKAALHPGENVLAVRCDCERAERPHVIDVGLVDFRE